MYCDEQILGGNAAEEEIQDLIEGVDEDGNTVMLEVVRYFFYNGEEYVVLGDAHTDDEAEDSEDEEEVNLYIMKVVEKEEDICCGTSKANSAIIHAGFDAKNGSLKAKLNVNIIRIENRIPIHGCFNPFFI